MEPLPLSVLLGNAKEVILFKNGIVAGLLHFELDLTEYVKTSFVCSNCFPRPSGHIVHKLEDFPLRIDVGDDRDQTTLTYKGKRLGSITNMYIVLSATDKRIIRLTASRELPDELNTALLDLGVEIIVQYPDTTMENTDAHL